MAKKEKSKKGLVIGVIAVLVVIGVIGGTAGNKDGKDDSPNNSVVDVDATMNEKEKKDKEEADRVAKEAVERKNEQVAQQKKELEEKNKQEQAKNDKESFIANCVEVPYKDLARTPDNYKGKKIKVTIQVNQVMTGGFLTESGYRGYEDYDFNWEDENSTYLEKEWYISYELPDGESKILENDVVVFYGEFTGAEEMKRALTGTTDYVPNLSAKYHQIISQ